MPVTRRSSCAGALMDENERAARELAAAAFDFDQLLERAIIHLHRHRRQTERWPADAT